jgi:hypothetical protein
MSSTFLATRTAAQTLSLDVERDQTTLMKDEDDVDNFFEAELGGLAISDNSTSNLTARIYLHKGEYTGDDLLFGQDLETSQRPTDSRTNSISKFKKYRDNSLYETATCSSAANGTMFHHDELKGIGLFFLLGMV